MIETQSLCWQYLM